MVFFGIGEFGKRLRVDFKGRPGQKRRRSPLRVRNQFGGSFLRFLFGGGSAEQGGEVLKAGAVRAPPLRIDKFYI